MFLSRISIVNLEKHKQVSNSFDKLSIFPSILSYTLLWACEYGFLRVVELVLLNMSDEELHFLDERVQEELKSVHKLEEHWTRMEQFIFVPSKRSMCTPLYVAVAKGYTDIVKLLLTYGVDPTARSKLTDSRFSYTCLELSQRRKYKKIEELLRTAIKNISR